MSAAILTNTKDNVATATMRLNKDDIISLKAGGHEISVRVMQEIPSGHKLAIRNIRKGEAVIKYGEIIGLATCEIHQGEHVHVHNIEGLRGRGDKK